MRIHVQNPPDDRTMPVTPEDWAAAADGAGHHVTFGDTPEAFRAAMGEAEALVTATRALRPLLPLAAPRLHSIFCTSAGLDPLAPFDWLPQGVSLLNNSGAHATKAAEYVLMAILMLANQMPALIADQHAGQWHARYGTTLAGRRLTVLGLGSIGGAAARLASAAGLVVTGIRTRAEPHPHCADVRTFDELDAVLPETDMLAITLPLTPATRRVLDRRRIALLPRHAGVVNIGRGGLLEQDALCDALDAGAIAGAVLDVFEPEPVPPGHRLWSTPNLVMTPHVSSDDPGTYNVLSLRIFLDNMGRRARGEAMPNVFDTVRGY